MFQSQQTGAIASTVLPEQASHPEKIRILIFGKPQPVQLTINRLHNLGYAEAGEWSDPLPTGRPGEIMRILTKTLLMG
ncbi:hypothetical protein [Almyronema epifaneia]|uniref:Uncharacterized protein n=1 Tax=Almyronema epifaneia S1 TaxID=2991925 RepID=A0ABW6II52_9CYAN